MTMKFIFTVIFKDVTDKAQLDKALKEGIEEVIRLYDKEIPPTKNAKDAYLNCKNELVRYLRDEITTKSLSITISKAITAANKDRTAGSWYAKAITNIDLADDLEELVTQYEYAIKNKLTSQISTYEKIIHNNELALQENKQLYKDLGARIESTEVQLKEERAAHEKIQAQLNETLNQKDEEHKRLNETINRLNETIHNLTMTVPSEVTHEQDQSSQKNDDSIPSLNISFQGNPTKKLFNKTVARNDTNIFSITKTLCEHIGEYKVILTVNDSFKTLPAEVQKLLTLVTNFCMENTTKEQIINIAHEMLSDENLELNIKTKNLISAVKLDLEGQYEQKYGEFKCLARESFKKIHAMAKNKELKTDNSSFVQSCLNFGYTEYFASKSLPVSKPR